MIEQCAYCIRKGQQPAADRSNIFPWGMVKDMDADFEPFIAPLPPLPGVSVEPSAPEKKLAQVALTENERVLLLRRTTIMTAFDNLQPEDVSAKTKLPLVAQIRTMTGLEDVSQDEVRSLWEERNPKGEEE